MLDQAEYLWEVGPYFSWSATHLTSRLPQDETLFQVAQLHALMEPEKSELEFLRDWLVKPDMADQ